MTSQIGVQRHGHDGGIEAEFPETLIHEKVVVMVDEELHVLFHVVVVRGRDDSGVVAERRRVRRAVTTTARAHDDEEKRLETHRIV